ncbi:hypothetical protein RCL1_004826 [Eukaryota sp. TZLM3-RCL]
MYIVISLLLILSSCSILNEYSSYIELSSTTPFPVVESVTGNKPTQGGSRITVQARNLGSVSSVISVRISERPCQSLVRTAANAVSCVLPSGVGTGHRVDLTVNGLVNNVLFTIDYDPPEVLSIEQGSSQSNLIDVSQPFNITGRNFFTDPRFITISMGLLQCTRVEILSAHTHLRCLSLDTNKLVMFDMDPPLLTVSVALQSVNTVIQLLPLVSSIVSSSGSFPCTGKVTVSLNGLSFYSFGNSSTVSVSVLLENNVSVLSSNARLLSNTLVTFELPPGFGHFQVILTIAGVQATGSLFGFYDPPFISQINADSAPTRGQTNLEIFGYNFYGPSAPVSLSFCGTPSDHVIIQSDTSLHARLPPGAGSQCPVVISIGSIQSKTHYKFSYDPPIVYYIDSEDQSKIQYSKSIAIHGDNFGTNFSIITVFFNNIKCPNVTLDRHHTLLYCNNLPPPLIPTTNVSVSIAGQASSIYSFSYFPSLYAIEGRFPTTGTVIISIKGVAIEQTINQNVRVVFDNQIDYPPVSINQNLINVRLPPGEGYSSVFIRWGTSNRESNSIIFNYDPPSIQNVTFPNGFPLSGGVRMNILAENLGINPVNTTTITVAHFPCTFLIRESLNRISCILPIVDTFNQVNVVLTVADVSSLPFPIKPDPSKLIGVFPLDGQINTRGNDLVLITSTGFGPTSTKISVLIHDKPCSNVQRLNISAVQCRTPPGSGQGVVRVTLDGSTSLTLPFSYDLPQIFEFKNVQLTDEILIKGQNFGSQSNLIDLFFGSFRCPKIALDFSNLHNQIYCLGLRTFLSQRTTRHLIGFDLSIEVNGLSSTLKNASFSPSIIGLSCQTSSSLPSTNALSTCLLDLFNFNFGLNYSLLMNSVEISSERSRLSFLEFQSISGCGKILFQILQSNNLLSFDSSYSPPLITSLRFPKDFTTLGNVDVLIEGSDLGTNQNNCELTLEIQSFLIDGFSMTKYDLTTLSTSSLFSFSLPPGFGNSSVVPSVAGIRGPPFIFSFPHPSLLKLVSSSGLPSKGNVSIHLITSNLPPCFASTVDCLMVPELSIVVDKSVCRDLVVNLDSIDWLIECTLPPGVGTVDVSLVVDSIKFDSLLLSYDDYQILKPKKGSTIVLYAGILQIFGSNFGYDSSKIELFVESNNQIFDCSQLTVVDHSIINCLFNSSSLSLLHSKKSSIILKIANQSKMIDDLIFIFEPISIALTTPYGRPVNGNVFVYITNIANTLTRGSLGISINQINCPIISNQSNHNQLAFLLPPRSSLTRVTVEISFNQILIASIPFTYDAPLVDSLSDTIFVDSPFVIFGSNFMSNNWEVLINNQTTGRWDCELFSDSRIECLLSENLIDCGSANELHYLEVVVDSINSDPFYFNLTLPFISSLSPFPWIEGISPATITGIFRPNIWLSNLIVSLGNRTVDVVESSTSSLSVLIPEFIDMNNLNLTVSICGLISSPYSIKYNGPQISTITTRPPTQGGSVIANGNGFKSDGVSVKFSGNERNFEFISVQSIKFDCPPGSGLSNQVSLSVNYYESPPFLLSYAHPVISSVSIKNFDGISELKILGKNFGPNETHVFSVKVEDISCENLKMIPHFEISCKVNGDVAKRSKLTVNIGGQEVSTTINNSRFLFWIFVCFGLIVLFAGSWYLIFSKLKKTRESLSPESVEIS